MTNQAPKPANEKARLEQLKNLMVLDTPPEALFDEIVKLASEVCGTPVALMSLVDENRQWIKANIGLKDVKETHRNVAFCAYAILQDSIMEVQDAALDNRFASNPLVTGKPNIRFYAGAPLKTSGGENIGTLCVINFKPQTLTLYQKGILVGLADIIMEALTLRTKLAVTKRAHETQVKTA